MEIVTGSLFCQVREDGSVALDSRDGAWRLHLRPPVLVTGGPSLSRRMERCHVEEVPGALVLHHRAGSLELALRVTPRATCFLGLEATVTNRGSGPVGLETLVLLDASLDAGGRLRYFRQGWQSWSHTASHEIPGWRETPIRVPFVHSMKENPASPPALDRWTSEMVTVLGREGSSLLAGLFPVDDRCGDLLLERVAGAWSLAARIHLDGRRLGPGQALRAGGVLLAAGPEGAPLLDAWADALAPRNPSLQARREKLLASVGWCTWYCHGRGIREETLREVTDHVVARPGLEAIRLVQLDDGYQRRIGDWLQPAAAFPSGLAAAVRGIRERGFDAGLWLTPLIAEPRSELFRSHPDWFLVDQEGNPVSGGWNPLWRTRFHALDCTRPQVRGWLAELFRRLRDLGVSFFKLDYLYPAAFPARRHNPDISRGGALRLGLEAIREAVGDDAMLLGCGAPLGPCRGLVDAMRISPDVAPFWRMRGPIPRLLGEDELHGRYASLRQTLARAFLHDRWWVNDPDVLLLQGAPAHEIRAQAAVIAASGGLLLLGDDPRRLGEDDLSLLQRVLSLRRRAGDCPDAVARTDPGILCPRGDAAGSVVRVNLGDSGAEIGGQTLPPRTAAWSDDP